MRPFLRSLFAAVLALWLAHPGVGGDGGENGSGSGVFILPHSGFFSSTSSLCGPGRQTITLNDLTRDATLTTSSEMGSPVATLVDQVSGVPIALPVSGKNVILPAAVMQNLLQAGVAEARILVVDGCQRGYQILLRIDAGARSATLTVY